MDQMLERLNKIYPDSKFVSIAKIDENNIDNKAPLNRWNTKPLSYDEAQERIENGERVGWVVPQDFVIVDIDNKDDARSQERIEFILRKFEVKYSYNYTRHGIHILFKDPSGNIKSGAKVKCGLNIEIDTRANGTGYIILPSNDPNRSWGEWNDFVEDIPYFLKPIGKFDTPSFIGMTDGDGRNDALFKWRSRLEMTHKLNESEIERTIRVINENLFETPMPNNELFKTVLRDKNVKEDKTEKFNPLNQMAIDLAGKYDFASFYSNFYLFNGTYYRPITEIELHQIVYNDVSQNLSDSQRKEVINFLKLRTQVKEEDFDKDWHKIACGNGILNLVTGEIEMPNKTEINTIHIPWNYNDDPEYSPRIDTFMKDFTDGDPFKMEFLYQIAGYCLLKKNIFAKFFIFQGEGGTGKSTFGELLHKLVGGDRNCSHISLPDMDKDYYLSTLVSKLLNVDDDVVDGKTLEYTGRFKSIVSGNKISVRDIYKSVMEFNPYATLIFNCNRLPRIMDNTSGLYRRMVLVQFNHKVVNPDPLFMNKVTDMDMEYLLFKAVQGIKTAIEEGHFRLTTSENDMIRLFKRRQSSISEWIYDVDLTLGEVSGKQCMSLFKQYQMWCDDNGYGKKLSMFSFKESICAMYDCECDMNIVDGKMHGQIFIKRGQFDANYRPF